MVTVGAAATDWANDGLFGDGWHLFGIGSAQYEEVAEEYTRRYRGPRCVCATWIPSAEDFDARCGSGRDQVLSPRPKLPARLKWKMKKPWHVDDMTVYYSEIPANADEESTVPHDLTLRLWITSRTPTPTLRSPIPQITACGCPACRFSIGNASGSGRCGGLAERPDPRRYRCRCWRGARLRSPDAGSVPAAGVPRGLRLHGSYRLRSGPYLPQVRSFR